VDSGYTGLCFQHDSRVIEWAKKKCHSWAFETVYAGKRRRSGGRSLNRQHQSITFSTPMRSANYHHRHHTRHGSPAWLRRDVTPHRAQHQCLSLTWAGCAVVERLDFHRSRP
jgi:hypothetical protein